MTIKLLKKLNYRLSNRTIPNRTLSVQSTAQQGFFSQHGQDLFIAEKVANRAHGFFVDIGANDGITFSNSYYFEKVLGWKGLAIEPHPTVYSRLAANRICQTVEACVAAESGWVQFLQIDGADMLSGMVDKLSKDQVDRIERSLQKQGGCSQFIKVPAYSLNDLLAQQNIRHVDYLSIDTEGGELDIVKAIDLDRFQIDWIGIENNNHDLSYRKVLSDLGYNLEAIIGCDEMYSLRQVQRARRLEAA